MKITIIGSGYVGLVSGACFADLGNDVVCLDTDEKKIALLRGGGIPIYEPGLQQLVGHNVAAGRLRFTTDVEEGVAHGAVQFIAVGTPSDQDGSADMRYVIAAARSIGRSMSEYRVVVNKSTVPVGTSERVRAAIAEELKSRGLDLPFSVVSNPEFLKEGGGGRLHAAGPHRCGQFRRTRHADHAPALRANPAQSRPHSGDGSALCGAHEICRQCDAGDPYFLHERTGQPVGKARYQYRIGAPRHRLRPAQQRLLEKVRGRFGEQLDGRQFAIWGLSFKPNTDDMREAPSRVVINGLLARGATVTAYDPVAMEEARKIFAREPDVRFANSTVGALDGADALIIVTEWKEFRSPDFDDMKKCLKSPVIFDGRNLYDPAVMRETGIEYFSMGRPQ